MQPVDGADHDVLIAGGEDHKTGQANDPDQRWTRIEQVDARALPDVRAGSSSTGPARSWSRSTASRTSAATRCDADNVFIHTGDSGMGMTHGTIAGILLTDLILGRENPWAKLYDPSRVNPKALHTYAKENLTVAAPVQRLRDAGAGAGRDRRSRRGTGAVVRRGLTKVAVYRTRTTACTSCSAVCPHMGCVVRWNYGERTWDCPCHGSRFDPYGRPINGPANEPLAPATPPRE